jgi:plastocyanin
MYRHRLIIAIAIVLVVGVGAPLYPQHTANDVIHYPAALTKHPVAAKKVNRVMSAPTIYFDNYGFDPNILHVPVGTKVNVTNISTNGILRFEALSGQPNQNYALDLGVIKEGQTKSFTITRSGAWQYEGNHNPSLRGLIGTAAVSDYKPFMVPDASDVSGAILIKYDDYGFLPNEIKIPAGTIVSLWNVTDKTQPGVSTFYQYPNSSPNPALNIGNLAKQQTKTFVLSTKGSWILENVNQPVDKGLASITAY